MEKKEHTPHDYSVDEILAETRGRFGGKSYAELIEEEDPAFPDEEKQESAPVQTGTGEEIPRALSQVFPFDAPPVPTQKEKPQPVQESQENAAPPPTEPKVLEKAPEPSKESPQNLGMEPQQSVEPQKKKGFWARRKEKKKKQQGFDETEDIYYGLQLKGIDEYKKGYDEDESEQNGPTPAFSYLFDDTQDSDVDEEIAQRFAVIHRERQQKRAESADLAPIGQGNVIYSYSDQALASKSKKPAEPIAFPSEEQKKRVLSRGGSTVPPDGKTVEFRMPDRLKKTHAGAVTRPAQPENKAEPESFDVDQILSERGFSSVKSTQGNAPSRNLPKQKGTPASTPKKIAVTNLPKDPPAQPKEPNVPQQESVTPTVLEAPKTETATVSSLPIEKDTKSVSVPQQVSMQQEPQRENIPKEQNLAPEELPLPEVSESQEASSPEAPVQETTQNPETDKKTEPEPALQETAIPPQEDASPREERRRKISALMNSVPAYHPYGRRIHVLDVEELKTALESEVQAYTVRTGKKHFLGNIPDEQAELGDEPLPQKPKEEVHTPEKGGKFNLFGEEEAESPVEEIETEEEELDDYNQPSDAPSVSYELKANIRRIFLRVAVTGIFTALLLILDALFIRNLFFPAVETAATTLGFLITNTVFLLIAMAFCFPAILNGWKGLITLHANSDSAVSVASCAALLQSIAQFFAQDNVVPGQQIHLYSALAVGALFLNAAGKLSMVRRIHRNFQFVASSDQKYTVEIYDDYNTSLQMAKGCVIDSPSIAYQKKAGFLRGFLRASYEVDPAETASQTIAPFGLGLSAVLCAVVAFMTKNAVSAITAFTASACVCVPVMNLLCANLPVSRLCRLARRCGTMVVGYSAVDQFSSVNAVMLDAKDLFPKGTVILNGIKTFGDGRIDDAIMDATAVMCGIGGPLSDLFDQILKTTQDLLPKASNVSYEDGRGVVGWVSGRRILVGSRDLMTAHGVEPPSRDYEKKYLTGGKQVIYLASGGKMMATFILTYNSDKRRALELQRMESNGVSLIVRTTDPNITPEFLAQCFRLDPQSVRVLPQRLGDIYEALVKTPEDKAPALFASRGRPTAMMRILTACIRQKGNISLAIALQNIAVALGFALVAFLSCFSGLDQLTTSSMLLYEVFWILVILIIPRLRKP